MLIAGLGGHVEEVFDVLIVKLGWMKLVCRQTPVDMVVNGPQCLRGLLRCDLW
jgi:hypothetical protein